MFGLLKFVLICSLGCSFSFVSEANACAATADFGQSIGQLSRDQDSELQTNQLKSLATDVSNEKIPQVSHTIQVNLPVEKVWAAIQARRCSDPSHRKLVSYDGKVAVIKEFFPAMPILGSATCTYAEQEVAAQKTIQYKMICSDRFRRFEGCWRLTPGSSPDTTIISLTTSCDPGIRIPFWEQIAKSNMIKDVKNNIAEVIKLALLQDKNPQDKQVCKK